MKKLLLSAAALCCFASAQAQNVFPSSGNVGLGLTNPSSLLHLRGSWPSIPYIRIGNFSPSESYVGETGGILFTRHYENMNSGKIYGYADWNKDSYQGISLRFATTEQNSAGPTDRMAITSVGNVGIGTTSPLSRLHIVGSEVRIQDPNRGRLQFFDNSGGNIGYSVRTAAGGGWAWQFVDGNNKVYFHVDYTKESVGIGTTNTGTYKLAVEGKAGAREVVVTTAPWADYVFASDYKLRPLSEVAKFIEENKHLPEVPTAAEIEKNGNNLGATDALLLKKIEELTLYVIEQSKRMEAQEKKIQSLEQELATAKR